MRKILIENQKAEILRTGGSKFPNVNEMMVDVVAKHIRFNTLSKLCQIQPIENNFYTRFGKTRYVKPGWLPGLYDLNDLNAIQDSMALFETCMILGINYEFFVILHISDILSRNITNKVIISKSQWEKYIFKQDCDLIIGSSCYLKDPNVIDIKYGYRKASGKDIFHYPTHPDDHFIIGQKDGFRFLPYIPFTKPSLADDKGRYVFFTRFGQELIANFC